MNIIISLIVSVVIVSLILYLIRWSTNRWVGPDKSDALKHMSEELEKTGDVDKFYKEFEATFYPNGYFEM